MTPTNRLEAIEARLSKAVDYNEAHRVYTERGASHDHWIYGYGSHDIPTDLAWAVARIREMTEIVEKKDAALLEAKIELDRNWGTFYDGGANGGSGTRRSNAKMAWFTVKAALALRVDAGEMK